MTDTVKARLVIQVNDGRMAAHIGGGVEIAARTFEIEISEEIADVLRQDAYYHANVVGIELPPKGARA